MFSSLGAMVVQYGVNLADFSTSSCMYIFFSVRYVVLGLLMVPPCVQLAHRVLERKHYDHLVKGPINDCNVA